MSPAWHRALSLLSGSRSWQRLTRCMASNCSEKIKKANFNSGCWKNEPLFALQTNGFHLTEKCNNKLQISPGQLVAKLCDNYQVIWALHNEKLLFFTLAQLESPLWFKHMTDQLISSRPSKKKISYVFHKICTTCARAWIGPLITRACQIPSHENITQSSDNWPGDPQYKAMMCCLFHGDPGSLGIRGQEIEVRAAAAKPVTLSHGGCLYSASLARWILHTEQDGLLQFLFPTKSLTNPVMFNVGSARQNVDKIIKS